MAAIPARALIVLTPAESYSSKEWEQKRVIITQQYRGESKNLNEVRLFLAQHYNFRPTAAMLKKRIRKWDLDKNHKQADMVFALRFALQRKARGMETMFLIRACVVTFNDIKQYFLRKGIRNLQSLVTDSKITPPTTTIYWQTPNPEKTSDRSLPDQETMDAFKELSLYDFDVGAGVVSPGQLSPAVHFSSTLHSLEQLLSLGRNHYTHIFENRNWRLENRSFELSRLEGFYHCMLDGQILLEMNFSREAFGHFNRAFDQVNRLLSQQTFLLLPYLYYLLLPIQLFRRQEIVEMMLDFISQSIGNLYPHLGSIDHSVSLLRRMSAKDRGESSERVFRSLSDRLRIEFEAEDVLDEAEVTSIDICLQKFSSVGCHLSNYQQTSIVVGKLAKDADILERHSSRKQIKISVEPSPSLAFMPLNIWRQSLKAGCTFSSPRENWMDSLNLTHYACHFSCHTYTSGQPVEAPKIQCVSLEDIKHAERQISVVQHSEKLTDASMIALDKRMFPELEKLPGRSIRHRPATKEHISRGKWAKFRDQIEYKQAQGSICCHS